MFDPRVCDRSPCHADLSRRSAQRAGGLATCTFSDTLRVPAQAGSWPAARGLTATHWSV